MNRPIHLQDIIEFLGNDVIEVFGDVKNVLVRHLKPWESVDEDTLDWVNSIKTDKQTIAENSKAKVILVDKNLKYSESISTQGKILIIVENPKMALLKIGNHFFVDKLKPGIHDSAVISPLAEIGKNFYAGANVSVGNCKIGNET